MSPIPSALFPAQSAIAPSDVASAAQPVMRRIDRIYHLAEAENLPSILERGLMSTERLLDETRIGDPERTGLLRGHRPSSVRLSGGALIRDQRPMPPTALAPALEDGFEPSDWYALLNGFVFFWADRDRMLRHLSACHGRPQALLTFDAAALFDRFAADAFVSPINSGNARRKAARRGRNTLVAYTTWLQEGWPTGQRTRPPAEILVRGIVPTQAPFLIDIAKT